MPAPSKDSLCAWLAHTTAASPAAPAIMEEDRVTSFSELLAQAQSLAVRFVEFGVVPQDRIVLVLPKTTDAIIALFATLFAGAICVPIHPQWPAERIESVVAECSARLVIHGDTCPPRITDSRTGTFLPWPESPASPDSLPVIDDPNPALILFTSGSSGQPKGVVLSHRAIATFVHWTASEFHITSADRIACPSPLGFDLSTFDIFNMALTGAACVLVPSNIVWMPRFLTTFIRDARITCWYSVPSILSGMLHRGRFADYTYPDLRLILFAGEVFSPPDVVRLQTAVPHALCANLYGPTETNVVTWHPVPTGFDGASPLPIGQPCPYAEITVDPATGELLAGGDSLMSGYWGHPQETARAFVSLHGHSFYRTGDRVQLDSTGDYTYLGRFDRQVKRRGFRIELAEIETALLNHADILEAAVIATTRPQTGTCLTAFACLRASTTLTPTDARMYCARSLPAYMLPDHILFIDAMPRGNRGKIDYAALSAMQKD